MQLIRDSRFWPRLWAQYYKFTPSIAFCRVPEMEYASRLPTDRSFLDHCCGDGVFARLTWEGKKLQAGCDIQPESIERARRLGIYGSLEICDVSKRLPYPDASFDLVFNNSALEHIQNLQGALREVARILKPDGEFAFNLLNHRFYQWWPFDEASKKAYRDWQPIYHVYTISEWTEHLANAGLSVTSFQGYFDQAASQQLARLDYWFSGRYLRGLSFQYVSLYLRLKPILSFLLWKQLGRLQWETDPDAGGGYFIRAARKN